MDVISTVIALACRGRSHRKARLPWHRIGSADMGCLLRPNDARRRQQPGSSSNRGSEDIRRAEGLRVQGLGFRV